MTTLPDTGERMIPTAEGELSVVFARHRFTYEYALQFAEHKRVLDVGCGTGYGSKLLAARASSVLGLDQDTNAISYSREHSGAQNIRFVQGNAEELAFRDEFDVAVSFQVIEHVDDTDDFVRRIKEAVKTGGTILLTTPNARDKGTRPSDNPFHVNEMNHREFSELLTRHFTSFELLGIGYAAPSRLRSIVQRSPLYALGRYLKRRSPIKKFADRALNLTDYAIVSTNVERDAIDLLAVCRKI